MATLEFLRSFDSKNGEIFKMYTEVRETFLEGFRKKIARQVEENDVKVVKELENLVFFIQSIPL